MPGKTFLFLVDDSPILGKTFLFLIEDSPVPGKTFLFLVVASSDLVLFPEPLCGVKAGVNSHVPTKCASAPLMVSKVLS